ncbi:MAG: 5,6-dimethylbenzimidazole synthase [Verrucomicrobia bacterium]|nr:MAG: 5,6-dimethylbenzimidazole synthase [Verrucomicrobiota bacterium]
MKTTQERRFSDEEREGVYRAIRLRRDMRHFRPDPVDPAVLARLLAAAHMGPSVGMMQPWRFVRITDTRLRERIHALVQEERLRTADALGARRDEFLRLKVEGIRECGELLVVALMEGRERHVFGRRTMPEMDLASVACAIENMWLAARAEGLGLGWVSLFEPAALARLLGMPDGASPVAILCVGHVEAFYEAPMLELEGWTRGQDWRSCVYENAWGRTAAHDDAE